VIVEAHPDPDRAWSDARETIDLKHFAALVRDCRAIAAARHAPACLQQSVC
jgi:3-deoxy-D-arabino-heptulosonate 7-phosphate (DAHP) synthase